MKRLNKIQKNLLLLVIFCIVLSLIRIKVTENILFTFLLWNLFLAIVPYTISTKLRTINIYSVSKFKLSAYLFIWLIFLPNAPYIITDLIHLPISEDSIRWLDLFLIFSYATTGLIFTILSLYDVFALLKEKWNYKKANYCIIIASFLSGFGIYLGRFLRFNSWDLFKSPFEVAKRSLLSVSNEKTWFITFAFGSFIYILFSIFRALKNPSESA